MLLLPTSVLACRRAVLRAVLLATIATVLLSGRGRAIAVLALGSAVVLAARLV